jgi:hypothetical protein
VLSGECRLLVDGGERLLRPWDFFHCPRRDRACLRGRRRRAVRDPDGRCAVGGLAGALPGVRVRRALRRERRGGDVRPAAGVRALRAVPPGAALVLGPPPLVLASGGSALDRMRASRSRNSDSGHRQAVRVERGARSAQVSRRGTCTRKGRRHRSRRRIDQTFVSLDRVSRSSATACPAACAARWPVTAPRKSSRCRAYRWESTIAFTVAVRGTLRRRAISPK